MGMEIICKNCGEQDTRTTSTQKYCIKCQTVTRTCINCNILFDTKRAIGGKILFCSQHCHHEFQTKNGTGIKDYICKQCGNPFQQPGWKTSVKFCSRSCKSTFVSRSHNRKDYVGMITYSCEYCSKVVTKKLVDYRLSKRHFCSRTCAHDAKACPGSIGGKVQSGKRTDIEAIVEQYLIEHNITYQFERPLWRYYIDFAIDGLPNIAIECDGEYWHQGEYKEGSDSRKDKYLANNGYIVIRLPGKSIHSGEFKDTLSSVL